MVLCEAQKGPRPSDGCLYWSNNSGCNKRMRGWRMTHKPWERHWAETRRGKEPPSRCRPKVREELERAEKAGWSAEKKEYVSYPEEWENKWLRVKCCEKEKGDQSCLSRGTLDSRTETEANAVLFLHLLHVVHLSPAFSASLWSTGESPFMTICWVKSKTAGLA